MNSSQENKIEVEVTKRKSMILGYLLLISLGWFGLHRKFYGYHKSGNVMMTITLICIPLLLVGGIGIYGIFFIIYWMILDILLIPFMSKNYHSSKKYLLD